MSGTNFLLEENFKNTIFDTQINNFTNTIEHNKLSHEKTDSIINSEDLETLDQIMKELAEINDTTNTDEVKFKGQLGRLSSIEDSLGDYFLTDFNEFETNIQINDPMLAYENSIPNSLNIF